MAAQRAFSGSGKISISPMLTLWSSSGADLKDNSATIDTGFRHSGATLQLGITFH